MTNWESESNLFLKKEKDDIQQKKIKIDLGNQEREKQITDLIKTNYKKTVIPGFETLDKYHIEEQLIEIKNEIWGGEISKFPSNYNEYYNKIIEDISQKYDPIKIKIDLKPENLLENYLSQFRLSENEIKDVSRETSSIYNIPRYILTSPQILHYKYGTNCDDQFYECIEETRETLIASSNGNIIKIGYEEIDISKKNLSEINNLIHAFLLKNCVIYKKEREKVLNYPNLLKEYNDRNSSKIPKRSFLNKLFGQ